MTKTFKDFGIDVQTGPSSGTKEALCPACSPRRKKKHVKCLTVYFDSESWYCHHCGWYGSLTKGEMNKSRPEWGDKHAEYKRPFIVKKPVKPSAEEGMYNWFKEKRGISKETVDAFGVYLDPRVWMPQIEDFSQAIAFPFFRQGEVINIKYRSPQKHFRLERDAERILYGLDNLVTEAGKAVERAFWCEGELDALALYESGYKAVVSVPNGAPSEKSKNYASLFDFVENSNYKLPGHSEGLLDEIKEFYIAVDSDAPGRLLEQELIRKLGPERCLRVKWPDGCKDANETLLKHGASAIEEAITNARHSPISGVYEALDVADQVRMLYDDGLPPGISLRWDGMKLPNGKDIYTVQTSTLTTFMGIPNMGKSTLVENIIMRMAVNEGWRFAVFSPETQPPALAIALLAEKFIEKPFGKQYGDDRMSREERRFAEEFIHEHFKFILPEEGEFTLKDILETTKLLIRRYGVNGLIIDAWNNLDDSRPAGMNSVEYLGQSLRLLNIFKTKYKIWCGIVVHPKVLQKNTDGSYPVPSPYDAMGGSHWFNKSDFIITIHRDRNDESKTTDIYNQKNKFRHLGCVGVGHLAFDDRTGVFFDATKDDGLPYYADTVIPSKRRYARKKKEPLPPVGRNADNLWAQGL